MLEATQALPPTQGVLFHLTPQEQKALYGLVAICALALLGYLIF